MDEGRKTDDATQLRSVITALEEEIAVLRRRLRESPARVDELETELARMRERLDRAMNQNDKLSAVLEEAREQLGVLREEVEKLTAPPNNFGTVLQVNDDGTLDIMTGSRKLRVAAQPNVEVKKLMVGQEVLLNEAFNIIDVRHFEPAGDVFRVREALTDGRVVVLAHADEERVLQRSENMIDFKLRPGDYVRVDSKTGLVLEKMERPEVEELVLEEVPDITYSDVGGLAEQIEQIRDTVELPYLHKDLFREYELDPPKGILLYGPPGCGKTLIAKAVANSLAQAVAAKEGNEDTRSYFLNIKGPELLNKYVGETERQIRLIFQRAKEKSDEGVPVIVFFDEMDSLFRTRGTGISSDIESTIVPQLLAEIDGVESLKNVIV
ncbi:MAG TPA: AAA family ATPase, partial [Acidimicrobiia bacterium]